MAVWILGGGVPKNYTLQGEPLLDQILAVPTHGFDIDVQFCVDPVDNGALSSCPAGEGHTWGKVSAESVASGSVYVHADVTAVFPWLTYALLSDPKMKRAPRRLYDAREAAVARLQHEVEQRRAILAPTLTYPLATSAERPKASAKGRRGR
jgi:deoxyhypusine synthase